MKKKLALILVFVLMAACLLPMTAMAQYDKELEKAIATAKNLFNISDGYDDFTYSMRKNETKTIFELRWNDSKNKLGTVNVTIDSDGTVISFYSYKPYTSSNQPKLPSVSKNQALKTAKQFIERVNPAIKNNIQYQENNTPVNINERSYRFNFIRQENGIPFPQNGANVSVDSMTGDVRNYSLNWFDNIKFPGTEEILSLQEAEKLYQEKLGLKLVYKISRIDEEVKPYLVYTSLDNNKFIDAKTGDIVTTNGYYGPYALGNEKEMHSYDTAVENKSNSLTPKEREAVEGLAGLISEKDAQAIVKNTLKIDSSYELENINLYKYWENDNNYVWSMSFNKKVKDGKSFNYFHINASVDAKTKEILNFYQSLPYDKDASIKYNRDDALDIAQRYIEKMQSEKVDDVVLNTWNERNVRPLEFAEEQRQYHFNFIRKANEALFINNGFNITVDTTTGNVISYNYNWFKGDLKPVDNILSSDEAHKVLFEKVGLQAQYIASNPSDFEKIMPMPDRNETPEIKLVYTTKPVKPLNIDAISGNILDYSGKQYKEETINNFTDIKGNFAEKHITVLAEFGISLPGEKFYPGKSITQEEFLYLILKSKNSWINIDLNDTDDIDRMYNGLIEMKIIKEAERNPDAFISRQEAVKYIIRALGYGKAAEIEKDIFKVPFKDAAKIAPQLKGHIAIAYGLNIINGNNGNFNPKQNLTRAQGAVIIYNYLNID